MKKDIDEHAARFDAAAETYDEETTAEHRASAALVIEHADPSADNTALDLGTGTGAIALELAPVAKRVIGRDISDGMLEKARQKAAERELESVEFDEGRFREPNVPADAEVDIVVSNFAMHHLDDQTKRDAIAVIASLEPRRFVLGDLMFFGTPDPDEPFYAPEVDDPATVGVLVEALTDVGFAVTAVDRVHDQVGVIVAERIADA